MFLTFMINLYMFTTLAYEEKFTFCYGVLQAKLMQIGTKTSILNIFSEGVGW